MQVKRRETEKVSAESLRAFMAVLGEQDVGIYISAAGFTAQAEREALSQEKRRLSQRDPLCVDAWWSSGVAGRWREARLIDALMR